MRLSFGYYENQYGKSVNEIYLSGGVAAFPRITEHLGESFEVKAATWDPFAKCEINPGVDLKSLEPVRSSLVVSAGLAMRK